jgi:hypothetical protein
MSGPDRQQGQSTFAAAAPFTGVVVVVASLVMVLALVWVSGCKSGSGDGSLAHCGGLQRDTLVLGSPLILLLGGVVAFVRTNQVWRARGRWWIWHGAGWFLLAFMLVALTMAAPAALL